MERSEHVAALPLRFDARVVTWTIVDLLRELYAMVVVVLRERARQSPEQRRLAIVYRPPALEQQHAARVVPPVQAGHHAEVERSLRSCPAVRRRELEPDGADFLTHPRVDGRRAQRVDALPADAAILERYRRMK